MAAQPDEGRLRVIGEPVWLVTTELADACTSAIVRPVKILNPAGEEMATSPSVRIGHEYLALEIYVSPDHRLVRVLDDQGGSPHLWPLEMFEVVSPRISSNWDASIKAADGRAHLDLAPTAWLRPGFWEDYYDRRWEGAGDEFDRAVADMAAEEGLPAGGRPVAGSDDL